MFRLRDLLLLVVILASLLAGVVAPGFSSFFQPYPLYCMMSLLFLAFLSIRITDVWLTIRKMAPVIVGFLFFRMIVLPICVTFLFRLFWPSYALSALLLSGISTGVVAPFFSTLLRANSPLVLVVVVTSSLLVPFTLPSLVGLLFSQSMEISLLSMMRLLLMVVFVPVLLAELLRRLSTGLVEGLQRRSYPISLVLFAITNMGIFSKYSEFFYQRPMTIVLATLVSMILGALYFLSGMALSWGRSIEDQLAAMISLGLMNNVLVVVFSSQFFTPIEPTVAAMYMIPFFGLLIPLRAYRTWKTKRNGVME